MLQRIQDRIVKKNMDMFNVVEMVVADAHAGGFSRDRAAEYIISSPRAIAIFDLLWPKEGSE